MKVDIIKQQKKDIKDDYIQDVCDFFNYHRKLTKAPKKYWQSLEQSKLTLEEWIETAEFNIINIDEQEIGFVHYIYINKTFVRLEDIYIREEFRSKGYGKKVLNTLDEKLKNEGVIACSVNVIPRNESALKFYIDNGFDHLNMIELRKNYDKTFDKEETIEVLGHTIRKY